MKKKFTRPKDGKRKIWVPTEEEYKEKVDEAKFKIGIMVPSHNIVPMTFAFDLAQLVGYSSATFPTHVAFHLIYQEGTYIHTMRQDLVEKAVMADCDYMLFLDSDMRFPKDSIIRLLQHDVDVVGINYAYRKVPTGFVALKERSPDNVTPAKKLWTVEESTGLEQVFAAGMGVMLIKTGLFAKIGPPPWFRNDYDDEIKRFVGEDVYFCMRCEEAGVPVFVDHDLSKMCAHTGQFEYCVGHAEAFLREQGETPDGPDNELQHVEDGSGDVAEPGRPDE